MEVWKDIPGYEGLYQASTMGNIRSVEGKVTKSARFKERHWKSRVLKWRGKQTSGGRVNLWKDGKPKEFLVHRLIAITFLGDAEEGMTVNHKNGDRFDNRVENIEWMSRADNIKYGFANGQYDATFRPVTIRRMDEEHTFRSCADCSRYLGRKAAYVANTLRTNRRTVRDANGAKYEIMS